MAQSDPLDKLGYILHLLEDLKYFHHTNAHVCSCDICSKKTSLVKSSISTAIDEIKDVTSFVRASSVFSSTQNSPVPSNTTSENPVVTISSPPTNCQVMNNCLTLENVYKQTSPLRMEEMEKHVAGPLVRQYSSACSSLLSSTQRDSGVLSENFLHSNSISPIKNSELPDSSSESSDSDGQKRRPNQHRICNSSRSSMSPYEIQQQQRNKRGRKNGDGTGQPNLLLPQSLNSISPHSEQIKPPLFLWPNPLPLSNPNFSQIFPPYGWSPLQNPHFAAPFNFSPQFISPLTTSNAEKSSEYSHDNVAGNANTKSRPQDFSSFQNDYCSWNYQMAPSIFSRVNNKHSESEVATTVPSSHVSERKDSDAKDFQHLHQGEDIHKIGPLPQIFETSITPIETVKPLRRKDCTDAILRKDVVFNYAVRSPSENDTINCDVSSCSNSSHAVANTSDVVNIKDVSGAMWRPWEAKEDVLKIISDLSIEEVDSAEMRLTLRNNSPKNKSSISPWVPVKEEKSQNENNLKFKNSVTHDVSINAGTSSLKQFNDPEQILVDSSATAWQRDDGLGKRGHEKAMLTPTSTKDTALLSESENADKPSLNSNHEKIGKGNAQNLEKSQPLKDNLPSQINDQISPAKSTAQRSLYSTSLLDISNTIKDSESKINNDSRPKIICENKLDEKENLNLAMEDSISSTSELDIVKEASKSSDYNKSKSPFIVKQKNQRKLSLDENIFPVQRKPFSSPGLKEKSFNLEVTSKLSDGFKRTVDSVHTKDIEAQGLSPSKQVEAYVVSSAHFPCMGLNRKLDFLNSSLQPRKSGTNIDHKSLQDSQSDSTIAEKNHSVIDQSPMFISDHGKTHCIDRIKTPSSENTDENLPQMPKWGAPAILESLEENPSDHSVPTNKEQMLPVERKSSCKDQISSETPSRSLHCEYTCKQKERTCLDGIDSQSIDNKVNSSDEIVDVEMNPRDYREEKVKEPAVISMEQTKSNGNEKDKRSRVTALCHDLLQMKLDSNWDQLNRSLPVSRPIQAHSQGNVEGFGSVSFEANQSFPKMGRQVKEPHVLGTCGATNQDVLDWCHTSTPLKCDVVTPRNRRSVFGLSPPEQLSLHMPSGHSSDKEQVPLQSQSESSSFSSHTEEEHYYPNLENVWETLDLSHRFPRLPTLKEILFNCVTGSICLIDLHRKGKIISVNESFQFLIGLHEKVVGQRLFRFIKIRHVVKTLAASVPHKIVLADGSVTTVCGKMVSCVVSTGEEMPASIWTVHLQSHPDIVACMIDVTPDLVGNFYVTDGMDFIQVDSSTLSTPLRESTLTPCTAGVLTGLIVVQSDGVIQNFDYGFFHLLLEYDELKNIHVSELFTRIIKTKEENKDEKPQEAGLNSSEDMHPNSSFGLGDVNKLTEMEPCHDPVTETDGLILPIVCFAEEPIGSFSHLSDSESINRSVRSDQDKPDFDLNNSVGCERMAASFSVPQTSTPCKKDKSDLKESPSTKLETAKMSNGIYSASFLHGNGSYIDVCMKVSSIQTAQGEKLFCLWVYIQEEESSFESDTDEVDSDEENSDDEEENVSQHEPDAEVRKKSKDLCVNKKDSDKMSNISLGQMVTEQAGLNHSHNATSEDISDLEQGVNGSFAQHYVTLGTLGQGSFGFVRRARPIIGEPKSVVVKFIRKRSMFDDGWIKDGEIVMPCEVAILRFLDNEYIIKILDVHQNNEFVQMVMEDFGELDLFDFIDQVDVEEPLACFIFKQITSGIEYLHSNNILHRDIKDENVIINSSFRCKLIDFGSAAYMLPEGQLFHRFRGTLEYCSPEIHLGEGYRGPELDAWALGITLYTMVFKENPYTADCLPFQMSESDFPFPVSKDLATVLLGLMCCDPCERYSVTKALGAEWLQQIVDMSKYSWEVLLGSGPEIKSCDETED